MSVPDQANAGERVINEVFVTFTSSVTEQVADQVLNNLASAVLNGVRTVHLMISTTGGNVNAGLTLYGALRALQIKLITYNIGAVDSIGNVLFLAADERYCSPHATFMFHGITWTPIPGTALSTSQLSDMIASIGSNQSRYAGVIVSRTKLTKERVDSLFQKETTLSAADAMEAGIVQGIRDPVVPTGSALVHIGTPR